MSNPAWAPDEDAATIYAEDTWLLGAFAEILAYGSLATLGIQCLVALTSSVRRTRRWRDGALLAFVVLFFADNTALVGMSIKFALQAFVNDRNYPGGPNGYEFATLPGLLLPALNGTLITSAFMADALLLWRCTVIYRNCWLPDKVVIGLACASWLAEFLMGTLFLVQLAAAESLNLTLGFWCLSLAINVIATLLISGRLLLYRHRLRKVLNSDHGSQYTGVVAMIVESEALYTAYLIFFIVPFALNHPLAYIPIQSISAVQGVAALMIVYRVAQGKAWSSETHDLASGGPDTIRLSRLSTFQAVGASTTFNDVAERTGTKSASTAVQGAKDMYATGDAHVPVAHLKVNYSVGDAQSEECV